MTLWPDGNNPGEYQGMFSYRLETAGYAGLNFNVGTLNWQSADAYKFWIEPDSSGQVLVIQICAGDVYWETYRILGNRAQAIPVSTLNPRASADQIIAQLTHPQWLEIPFNEFLIAPWQNVDRAVMDKSNVSMVSFYVNALNNATVDHGQIVLDDIQVVNRP